MPASSIAGGAFVRRPGATQSLLLATAICVAAAAGGVAAATHPLLVLAPLGAFALVAFAFVAPVTHLGVLLFLTGIVGYELQKRFSSYLLASDAVLLTGLLRASFALIDQRLDRRRIALMVLMVAFMGATVVQVWHGLREGHGLSQVGAEGRELLGFGALLIAMPIVADPAGRLRLGRALMVLGVALGAWGLAQWSLHIAIGENVDVGVRTNSDVEGLGNGQLHGGLYGYPVAAVMAAAALLSGVARRPFTILCLSAILVTNLFCLILTYERTFWLTTIAAIAFVIAKLGPGRRFKAATATLILGLATLGFLATVVPEDLIKIRDRVLSVGEGTDDDSVRYRVNETRHVLEKISERPLEGSGLGDTIYWGRAWQQVPPSDHWFAHNGYLWVTWKTGVIVAMLLFALLAWAVVSRAPPGRDLHLHTLRIGAQGGLLVLLLSSITFPAFNSVSITALMGVLLALCFAPRPPLRASHLNVARAPATRRPGHARLASVVETPGAG
jgi:O-antigen ligase